MKTVKYIIPLYGIKPLRKTPLQLEPNIILRSVDLLNDEHKLFVQHKMRTGYEAVLEVDYEYDENDPSEPLPGIMLRLLDMFNACLNVYDKGLVGVAAVLPADGDWGGYLISHAKPSYRDYMEKDIDEEFVDFYKKFKVVYVEESMGFDAYRQSRDRYANNDKTKDCCTALEDLFVPKGSFAKKEPVLEGIKKIGYDAAAADRIGKLIDYRNAIIHADKEKVLSLYKDGDYTFSWFEETFELVRYILFKFTQNS